jgi:protein SCO1/2
MKHGIPFCPPSRIIPLLLAAALFGCGAPEPPRLQAGTLVSPPRALETFELVDHHGNPFGPQNLKDHWTFVFFGYTHCPDVCPTALAVLGRLITMLESDGPTGDVARGLFISVDPQRDAPQTLASYVTYFHPDLIGATGSPDEIGGLARQLGIFYARTADSGDSDYLIDHSASLLLFDPDGRLRALFSTPQDPGVIAADFRLIREFDEASL